ncbi:ankyrin repeat domain-containing protein [Thalassotalea sp. G20_0]|uniref:ankyrin repeat domain-containing protein n=1 Tax=Thalassotalea sp. G20_0 TaxID=2821093 RepID=UPI001AD9B940|nr:ankyrin repeat domain-containing protein [Thalassotalea sp. G20_0]MBO9496775.1 ankyrin repeat domain-containing protein [Thalassotalea sp. G20_0]
MNTLADAAADGDLCRVETLLANGADPNSYPFASNTPLQHAARAGYHAIVKILLDYGADPNHPTHGWLSALEYAADYGHLDVYKTLLPVSHQLDWNSLLHNFSDHGWEDQVKMALAKGADPNILRDGYTPLHHAAAAGHLTIVEALLANGADPNILGNGNYTSLHKAAIAGHCAIVKTLLASGANPNIKRMDGLTALQSAVNGGHLDVYKTLLPKTHQLDWNSLLQKFSIHGWADQVEVALVKGADPNRPGVVNYTPLHRAAYAGHLAIVETLLASGADPNMPGKDDHTPLHQAVTACLVACKDRNAIVETLLVNGADPNLRDKHGRATWQHGTPATKNIIRNFISVPRLPSLKSRCRSSIRGRLIKHLDRNKRSMKQAVNSLPLPYSVKQYIYLPLLI